MSGKTVLVLGGGVGGIVAARRLRSLLSREHRVMLFDRESHHLFQPSLLWLAIGDRRPERIQRPLAQLRRKGIDVVQAEIERIDPIAKTVSAGGRQYTGETVILSLGAVLAPEGVPGLVDGGHNLFTLSGAMALRDALRSFRGGRIALVTAVPAYKCPAAPYEAAMLIEYDCRRRGIRNTVDIDFFAAEPGPMGVAGPIVSASVRQMVEAKGIRYHPEHQVTAVDSEGRRLRFANGATAQYDLLVYVPPHRAPPVVREAGLTGESGWVDVDRQTFATRFPGVFAIGDVTIVPLKMGKPLPKAGVFAHGEAEVVAANVAAAWAGGAGAGQAERRTFDGYGACFVETGDARAGFGAGDFYAEPAPQVKLRAPSRWLHWGKVLFEWRWFRKWL